MVKKHSFMYDDFSDRLMISCKRKNDVIKGSIKILNLVLDFTADNRIANIELKNASDYIKSLGFKEDILKNLTDARLLFKQCRDGYLIYFILQSGKQTERIPYNIHSKEIPVLN